MFGTVIDPGIKPLVDAMNNSGWVITVSSCEGHDGSDPYVAFYCRADKINLLCNIMDDVEHELFPLVVFNCCLVHDSEVHGSQRDAPAGWVALHMQCKLSVKGQYDRPVAKHMVLGALVQRFSLWASHRR